MRFPLILGSCFLVLMLPSSSPAQHLAAVPAEMASSHFTVTVNKESTPVLHAAVNLYFLNFDVKPGKRTEVSVTADRDDFWAKGIEVQPWRLGIRPKRDGRTIRFTLDRPQKISISRPGDYLGDAEMLYLFANAPETGAPTADRPGLKYFGPGVHRENIDATSGETIYLAPGAIVFGALNVWGVDNVRVFGRGVIVYDGPQNPADDDGWMHKRNWHCIVMDQAHSISIEGITCVVRSRTWQIQMKDSHNVRFENVKVIGANEGNANADGMDWLGGGDTVVKDSFFRAADDIFAMQGSWEGYGPVAFAVEGKPVTNVTVEDSVLSTSISNVVRAGWPEKNFEGGHFIMRNSDVLHMGMGGCGIPFALMEIWADPNGRGESGDFRFENVRMEDWYSLVQLMEPVSGITNVRFTDVAGLETGSLVPSLIKGQVHGTTVDNVVLGGTRVTRPEDLPIAVEGGAETPTFATGGPQAKIRFDAGLVTPRTRVTFKAETPPGTDTKGLHYLWSFGDGTEAKGRKVKHTFPDTAGTLWDGSGRFRVLLHTTSKTGRSSWEYAPVVVTESLRPATSTSGSTEPGLTTRYTESDVPTLTSDAAGKEEGSTVSAAFAVSTVRQRPEHYSVNFSGYVDVPVDGSYTFTLLANDAGRIMIDEAVVGETPKPFAQVCGLKGNALRPVTVAVALAKGKHRISVKATHTTGEDGFRVLWQAPGMPVAEVPATALSHDSGA